MLASYPYSISQNSIPVGPTIDHEDLEQLDGILITQEMDLKWQAQTQRLYMLKTHEILPEPTVNEPKVVSQPKVWYDAPIIEEYESDSKDEHVSLTTEELETPSFANKQVKSPRETVKNQFTHSKNPKVNKKGLGYRSIIIFEIAAMKHHRGGGIDLDNEMMLNEGKKRKKAKDKQKLVVAPPRGQQRRLKRFRGV
ncbi:hypothetical protein Tco_0311987 [Tanacetum coccineum]